MFEACPPLAGSPAPAGCEGTVTPRLAATLEWLNRISTVSAPGVAPGDHILAPEEFDALLAVARAAEEDHEHCHIRPTGQRCATCDALDRLAELGPKETT